MKNFRIIALLSAGIILLLAGCQKGPEGRNSANLIKFKAISSAPVTRTAYATGEGAVTGGVHRIDWKAGDQVVVWSDEALNQLSTPTKQYTYDVGTITTNGAKSIATAYDDNSQGLTWTEGVESFKFCAYYPAGGYTDIITDGDGNPTSLTATIPASQAISGVADGFGSPDMKTAFLLANPISVQSKSEVDLQFAPYFTCFELNVSSTDAINIASVTLISEQRTNEGVAFGPSTVSGAFTAALSSLSAETWTVEVPSPTTSNVKTVATFNPAIELTKANESDAKTNEVKFVVFAVPQDIASLTFDFELSTGEHRFASLSYAKTENGHTAGDPVTFAARKKHNINGLTLAPINKETELILKVVEWTDASGTVTYGTEAIANAVALDYASGAAITSGGGRRQNNNFAVAYDPGTGSTPATDANPIVAYFSVFAPYETSGTTVTSKWEITVTGATDKMDVNISSPATGTTKTKDDETGTIVLSGPTGTRVEFKISRIASVSASDQIQLNFAVVMSDGRRFSINSEITRANALTISGKVGN